MAATSSNHQQQHQQQQPPRAGGGQQQQQHQAGAGAASSSGGVSNSNSNSNAARRPTRWGAGPPPFAGQQQQQQQQQQGSAAASPASSHSNSGPASSQFRSQSPLNPAAAGSASSSAAAASTQKAQTQTDMPSSSSGPAAGAGGASAFPAVQAGPADAAKMHDRMLFLIAHLVGQKVTVTVRTGLIYSGILSSVNDSDFSVALRLVRQVDPPVPAPAPVKPALVISARDVIDVFAEQVDLTAFSHTAANGTGAVSGFLSPVGNGTAAASTPASPTIRDPGGASIMAAMLNGSTGAAAGSAPDSFRTDVDISGQGSQRDRRELQRWGQGPLSMGGALEDGGIGGSSLEGDDEALEGPSGKGFGKAPGQGKQGGAWDQFSVNERLFGTKTDYQEEFYTTKLDKSGADYKAREKKAERLAQEIQSGVASNAHVAEERGLQVDDSGLDEEDKYSGVIRGANAYVPPGARRATGETGGAKAASKPQPAAAPATNGKGPSASEGTGQKPGPIAQAQPVKATPALTVAAAAAPQVSVTASDAPAAQASAAAPADPAKKVHGEFQKFVSAEKEKLLSKRAMMEKQNKEKKLAELRSFSTNFVLRTRVPEDLVPILAKDETKQKEIANKKPATPSPAQSTGSLNLPVPAATSGVKPASTNASPLAQPATLQAQGKTASMQPAGVSRAQPASPAATPKKASPYALSAIPSFKDLVAARAAKQATPAKPAPADVISAAPAAATGDAAKLATPTSTKFNVAAPAFVMRPTAGSFTPTGPAGASAAPGSSATSKVASPVVKPQQPPLQPAESSQAAPAKAPNPFFGTKNLRLDQEKRRTEPLRVKEDFSPFTAGEFPLATTITSTWGFTGKSYRNAAPSPGPSSIGMLSPQPAAGLPPHLAHQMRGMRIASPPPSALQPNPLVRTASSQGGPDETTGPASIHQAMHPQLMSAAGAGMPQPSPQGMPGHHVAGMPAQMPQGHPSGQPQQQMFPQGYIFHPGQPVQFQGQGQPGAAGPGVYRYMPNGPQQGQQQQQGVPPTPQQLQQLAHAQAQAQAHAQSQQGHGGPGPMQQFIIGPNGQPMHFAGGPGGPQGHFVQMPFSPQMHAAGQQPMFSPQMANHMAPGQFLPQMYPPQGGPRGPGTPQMAPGGQHVYYQQQPGMQQQQFMQMPVPHGQPSQPPPQLQGAPPNQQKPPQAAQ